MSQPKIDLERMGKFLAALPSRIPSRLLLSEEAKDAIIARVAMRPAGEPSPDRFMGVPVITDGKLMPGQWRMLDQHGHTMAEGNLFA